MADSPRDGLEPEVTVPLARCLGIDGAAPAEAGVRLGQPAFHATLPLVAIATDCDTLGKAQHRILLVLFHARAARQARRIVAYDARGPCAALAWLDARTLVLALGADIEVLRLPRDAFEGGVDASSSDWLTECEFETFSFHVSPIRELAVVPDSSLVLSGGDDGQVVLQDFTRVVQSGGGGGAQPCVVAGHDAAERVSSIGLPHGPGQPRVATFTTDGGRFECVDFRAAPRASARLAFQARAAEPALYAHASGLARGDGAALGFGSGCVALYDVRRLPLPVATARAGAEGTRLRAPGVGTLLACPARGSSGGLFACGGGGACELSLDGSAIADADRRRGAGGARRRAYAASGPLAPRRSFEYDGVVGGAVWYGRARVGITTATDLHICALGGAAESARYSSAVRAF